ncbi:SAM-dependent methyltransferase, partial [Campylobacter coli]
KLKDEIKELKFDSKRYLSGKLLMSNLKLIFGNKVIWLCIVGIPWSLLRDHEQEKLLKIIHKSLKPNGYFSTFAYVLPTYSSL